MTIHITLQYFRASAPRICDQSVTSTIVSCFLREITSIPLSADELAQGLSQGGADKTCQTLFVLEKIPWLWY